MELGRQSVLLMRAESRPWDIGGQSGIAYSLFFLAGGKVYKARTTKELYSKVEGVVQQQVVLDLFVDSRNDNPRLECTDIEL